MYNSIFLKEAFNGRRHDGRMVDIQNLTQNPSIDHLYPDETGHDMIYEMEIIKEIKTEKDGRLERDRQRQRQRRREKL